VVRLSVIFIQIIGLDCSETKIVWMYIVLTLYLVSPDTEVGLWVDRSAGKSFLTFLEFDAISTGLPL